MVRRLQLLEPEHRPSAWSVTALVDRIRDGLLRDNKVIPAVLGGLALLVFAWLIAGALIGDPGQERQAANQAALSQAPDEDPPRAEAETPAPEVENRDTDSFAVFEPKDPFRELVPPADVDDREPTSARARDGNGRAEADRAVNGDRNGRSTDRKDGVRRDAERDVPDDREDFIDQTFPEESRDTDIGEDSEVTDDAAGRDGTGNLFGSGGNLPPP